LSSDGGENLLAFGSGRFYWRDIGPHLFFGSLELGIGRNLDGENQILLGGDSGLRGYPLRYQSGDARALLTLEQRFFTGLYPFRLFFVGAAVFFDAGRTWPGDGSGENLGWLRDVGVGLRLSSSRSGFGTVMHLDVAFPLDGDASIDSLQWLITTKQSL
jgi:hemolysin activation/secretion protein